MFVHCTFTTFFKMMMDVDIMCLDVHLFVGLTLKDSVFFL